MGVLNAIWDRKTHPVQGPLSRVLEPSCGFKRSYLFLWPIDCPRRWPSDLLRILLTHST